MKRWAFEPGRIYEDHCTGFLSDIAPEQRARLLIVSDPPYNIGFKYANYTDNMTAPFYREMIRGLGRRSVLIHYAEETMRYFVPALGIPDKSIAWCYNSNLPRQFRLVNFFGVVPDMSRVRQPYKNPDDIRVAALMESGSKGTDLYDWFDDIQQVKNVSEEKTAHPCPVPVALMERIITLCAKPGDIIYDPFMGSGTTAIAAIRCGHEWIGTEIDPEYVKIAEKRISLDTAQLKFV